MGSPWRWTTFQSQIGKEERAGAGRAVLCGSNLLPVHRVRTWIQASIFTAVHRQSR